MKQLLLTIKNPDVLQLEVKDFLDKCAHSPEWIGDADHWEIKSFNFHVDGKGYNSVTALLENNNWVKSEGATLTAIELYDLLKGVPRNYSVDFGIRRGINGRIESYAFGVIDSVNDDDRIIIQPDKQNAKPVVSLSRLLETLNLPDDTTLDFIDGDAYSAINRAKHEKPIYFVKNPITEIIVDDNNEQVLIIYNQDTVMD